MYFSLVGTEIFECRFYTVESFIYFSSKLNFYLCCVILFFLLFSQNNAEGIKMRGKIQQLVASYFTSQNSYPRAQEFRDQVVQHKEPRMPLNFYKYSFVHPEQAKKWYLCTCEAAVLIKQVRDCCRALKSGDTICRFSSKRRCFGGMWLFVAGLGCSRR